MPEEPEQTLGAREVQPTQRPIRRRRRRTVPAAQDGVGQTGTTAAAASPQPLPQGAHPFVHPSEAEFARILDFYGLKWVYEPRSFPLRWSGDHIQEMFTPDFYLSELDLYIELTTLKQILVTEKNRKLRLMRELYPEVNIKLLYKRDYQRLLAKYGYGPLVQEEVRGIERVLFSTLDIQRRVEELALEISGDYQGHELVLVGVLRGVLCFMADLMRHMPLTVSVDFMAISYYSAADGGAVEITKDLDMDISGRHVLLVEDIVDTGLTLNYILSHLRSRGPASLKVCTLLDKQVRRLVDIKLDYVGFEIPDEFVVEYGLDYLEAFRNLPFIGVLKPEAPATPSEGEPAVKVGAPQAPPLRRQRPTGARRAVR